VGNCPVTPSNDHVVFGVVLSAIRCTSTSKTRAILSIERFFIEAFVVFETPDCGS
jgi:hypothetical protein